MSVVDNQKDEASNAYPADQSAVVDDGRLSSSSSTEDKTLTKKKLPRVILRLGKPPDSTVTTDKSSGN